MYSSTPGGRPSNRKRLLVCGGAGFLGTHLCERLLSDGHEVIAVDNLSSGTIDHLRILSRKRNFSFVRHDIVNPLRIEADEVFNVTCCAPPPRDPADPEQVMRTCVEGSLNLLAQARHGGTSRIFLASTCQVYGEPETHPQRESYRVAVNPMGQRACYEEAKRCAEALYFEHHRQYGLPIKVARVFNTYGPRMRTNDGRVVSRFIMQALRGEPITVNGAGTQTRSFCFVDDLVDGIVRLMASDASMTGPMNLGNPTEISILDLAKLIVDVTGSRSRIVHRAIPTDDTTRRCPDITLAQARLDWQPMVPLREGLRMTVDWFEHVLGEREGRRSQRIDTQPVLSGSAA